MAGPEAAPIIETVVTTLNPDRSVNCGAMGVEWGEERIAIKPYRGTRTLRNLRAGGAAVVNLTDDILFFVQAALADPRPGTRPRRPHRGAVIADACSWREVEVVAIDDSARRARIDHARRRPRHRAGVPRLQPRQPRGPRGVHPRLAHPPDAPEEIARELGRLQVVVDKTAGPREHEAMAFVREHVGAAVSRR